MPADRGGGHPNYTHPAGPSSSNASSSTTSRRPYAKANRSLRACDICHSRKTRCSGQIPCKFCISRGLECTMSDDTIRPAGNSKSSNSGGSGKTGGSTSRSQERASLQYAIERRHAQKSSSPAAQGPVPLGSITGTSSSYPGHLAPLPQPGFKHQQQHQEQQPRASTSGSVCYTRPPSTHGRSSSSTSRPVSQSPSPPKAALLNALPALPALPLPFPPPHHPLGATQSLQYERGKSTAQAYDRNQIGYDAPPPTHLLPPTLRHSRSPPGAHTPIGAGGKPVGIKHELENYNGDTIFNFFQDRRVTHVKEADITTMIPRLTSNRYLDLYFAEAECVYQLWPVPSIIQHCHDTIWGDPSALEHPTRLSMSPGLKSSLTAALAFGAFLDRSILESEALYHAARSCFLEVVDATGIPVIATTAPGPETMLAMNLEGVQLGLQLAVFEMNTNRARAACTSIAIAIRLAQSLGLHRKSSLYGCSPEEAMRRSQLWYCCMIQDAWLSMSTGSPPFINLADSDLESPSLGFPPEQTPTFTSPFFAMSIRLASTWHGIHAKLFRFKGIAGAEKSWIEALPGLDTELRLWQKDIHQMYTRLGPRLSRAERLHCQAILLMFTPMRLAMHRAYLRMRIPEDQQNEILQRVMSQTTVIEAALDIAAYTKASIQLGMRTCFAFLGTSLHLACLGLWEYCQQKPSSGHSNEIARAEKGLDNTLWMIEHIAQGGENQSMSDVLLAVEKMRSPPTPLKAEGASSALPGPSMPHTTSSCNGLLSRPVNYRRLEGYQQAPSTSYQYDQSLTAPNLHAVSTSAQHYEERLVDHYPQSHHRTVWSAESANSGQQTLEEPASAHYIREATRDVPQYH